MDKYLIAILTHNKKVGFYTGDSFDTSIRKAKKFNKRSANSTAKKIIEKIEKYNIVSLAVLDANLTIKQAKEMLMGNTVEKNPIGGSRQRREEQAANLYESFTGHKAESIEVADIPQHDTGLKVGKCLGIMYETIRDGKKESYLHEFEKTSQPDFCVSFDGQQIYLIGGAYLFKDSGINDI